MQQLTLDPISPLAHIGAMAELHKIRCKPSTDVTCGSPSATIVPVGSDRDAVEVGELFRKAKGSLIDSANYILECGRRLNEKKGELGHGHWLKWLDENKSVLGFSEKSAERMMLSTKKWDKANPTLASNLTEDDAQKISQETWHQDRLKKLLPPKVHVEVEEEEEEYVEVIAPGQALPNSARVRGLLHRAMEAKELAEADDMDGVDVTEKMIEAVAAAASAWIELGKKLNKEN